MTTGERRITLATDFERALESVLGAFEREGFHVRPVNGNGRFRVESHGRILRCAELDVTLPELTFAADLSAALLGCRISMFELSPNSTLVTANSPLASYSMLLSLMPRMLFRVRNVLHLLVGEAAQTAA